MANRPSQKNQPPGPNELELSLFGPGVGECVVVHLGRNEWMVIDSCLSGPGGRAVALDYFESLGVDPSRHVKMVVVTHWHDDHIRGAAQVLRASSSARFSCSAALAHQEFFTLVHAGAATKLAEHTSGVSEFADILEELTSRAGDRISVGPDSWAQDGMQLLKASSGIEVHALSPSAQTITDAQRAMARLAPSVGSPTGRIPVHNPNDLSVVVLVTVRKLHFLLGGDLEHVSSDYSGWKAVVNSATRPRKLAIAYKVAHHGSENADSEEIWSELTCPQPYAILTPYARGIKPLPSATDIKRIKTHTKNIYCTIKSMSFKPPRRPAVDRTINEVAKNRRAIKSHPGHVRIRAPISGDIEDVTVEMFDGAGRL